MLSYYQFGSGKSQHRFRARVRVCSFVQCGQTCAVGCCDFAFEPHNWNEQGACRISHACPRGCLCSRGWVFVMCTRFLCGLAFGLAKHRENTTLKKLRLGGNAIETEGKAALRKAQEVISLGDRVPFFFRVSVSVRLRLHSTCRRQAARARPCERHTQRHRLWFSSDMDLTRGHSSLHERASTDVKCSIVRGDEVS